MNDIVTIAPVEVLGILDSNIVTIIPAGFVQPRFGDPDIQFTDAECSCPSQFIPCTWDDQTFFKITNNGDASDICQLGVTIEGHTAPGSFIPISDPFHMDADQSMDLQLDVHFNEEYWTETENIVLKYIVGFWINDTQIQITDDISFNTEIYVPDITCSAHDNEIDCVNAQCYWWSDETCHDTEENGNGVPCEGRSQAECTAPCHWYSKYFWESPSCHTAEQNMMMDYLPFIIAGVGGTIIIVALLAKPKAKPAPTYHPPPQYYPPPKYPPKYPHAH